MLRGLERHCCRKRAASAHEPPPGGGGRWRSSSVIIMTMVDCCCCCVVVAAVGRETDYRLLASSCSCSLVLPLIPPRQHSYKQYIAAVPPLGASSLKTSTPLSSRNNHKYQAAVSLFPLAASLCDWSHRTVTYDAPNVFSFTCAPLKQGRRRSAHEDTPAATLGLLSSGWPR